MNSIAKTQKIDNSSAHHRNKPSVRADRVRSHVLSLDTGEHFSSDAIAEKTGTSIHTVRDVLSALRNEKKIEKEGSPRWGITWTRVARCQSETDGLQQS